MDIRHRMKLIQKINETRKRYPNFDRSTSRRYSIRIGKGEGKAVSGLTSKDKKDDQDQEFKKLKRKAFMASAGGAAAGLVGAAAGAYGVYKGGKYVAKRLRMRKICKQRYPNDAEKYYKCIGRETKVQKA